MGIFKFLDAVANALAYVDVVGAVGGAIAAGRAGDTVGFEIPNGAGWSGRSLRRTLEAHGIEVIGLDYRPGGLRFSVRREDADRALAAMTREGRR